MASGFTWFRVDTDLWSNPKIVELIADHGPKGKAAAFVYIAAIGYCAQHLTDGVVKKGVLSMLHGTPSEARLLVDYRLFQLHEKGWEVVNYGAHQPTRQVAEQLAARRSDAARAAANARWASPAVPA